MNRQRGISLIELVISIVIIGIAVIGILKVMEVTAKHSSDPLIQHQAVAIAEAYLEEIVTKSFTVQPETGGRVDFDDVDDYNGLSDAGARDQFDNAIPGLENYSVSVTVSADTLDTLAAKRIDVRVQHTSGIDVTLSSYRTNY